MKGVQENRKIELVEMAQAMTVAVSHCLDGALGKGRGEILQKWTELMLGDLSPEGKKHKKVLTDRAAAWLNRMPTAIIRKDD